MSDNSLVKMEGLGGFGSTEDFVKRLKEAAGDVGRGTATPDELRDAMGRTMPKLEKYKVKHGGACIFLDEAGKKHDEVTGVVVAYTYHNSFFDRPFEEREEGDRPPCFSNDGETVAARAERPNATGCGSCKHNRDAVDKEAREAAFKMDRKEACHNYLSLAVALPGREIPVHIQLSNSSFRAWSAYNQRIFTQGRFKVQEVATKLTLGTKTGPGGSEYSVCKFDLVAPLPRELAGAMLGSTVGYTAVLRREAETDRGDAGGEAEAAAAVAAARASQAKAAQGEAAL